MYRSPASSDRHPVHAYVCAGVGAHTTSLEVLQARTALQAWQAYVAWSSVSDCLILPVADLRRAVEFLDGAWQHADLIVRAADIQLAPYCLLRTRRTPHAMAHSALVLVSAANESAALEAASVEWGAAVLALQDPGRLRRLLQWLNQARDQA